MSMRHGRLTSILAGIICSVVLLLIGGSFAGAQAAKTPTQYGPIKGNDSLWSIAKRLRPNERISVEEMAQRLFEHNPSAFLNNNRNHLKPGAMLYVPPELLATAQKTGQADKENKENKEKNKKEKDIDAPALKALQSQLDRLQAENQQLKTRLEGLSDAEGRLHKLQQQNSYQSDQIKALRQELEEAKTLAVKEQPPTPTHAKPVTVPMPAKTPESPPVTVAPLDTPVESVPMPVETTTSPTDRGIPVYAWLGAGGAGLILAGLVGLGIRRRRVNPESAAVATQKITSRKGNQGKGNQETREDNTESLGSVEVLLTQADIELAKQNLKSARALLQRAQAMAPNNPEIRLRLLEMHHQAKEVNVFDSEAKALHAILPDTAHPIWQKVVAMAQDLNSQHPLFAMPVFARGAERISAMDIDAGEDEAGYFHGNAAAGDQNPDRAIEDDDAALLPPTEMSDLGLDEVGYLFHDPSVIAEDGVDALAMAQPGQASIMTGEADFDPLAVHDEPDESLPKISAVEEPDEAMGLDDVVKINPDDGAFESPAAPALLGDDDSYFAAYSPEMLSDEVSTKLELAQAFLDMGDHDQARDILQEVLADGAPHQRQQANELLAKL